MLHLKPINALTRRTFMAATMSTALILVAGEQRAIASDDPAVAYVRSIGNDVIAILGDKENQHLRGARSRVPRSDGERLRHSHGHPLRFWGGTGSRQPKSNVRTSQRSSSISSRACTRSGSIPIPMVASSSRCARSSPTKAATKLCVRRSRGLPARIPSISISAYARRMVASRVVDLYVEGISMLHTHRVEFSSVVNRDGIDGLLRALQARIDAPVEDVVE